MDEDIEIVTYRMEDGTITIKLNHLPTGVSVTDDTNHDVTIRKRVEKLKVLLKIEIEKHSKA